MTPADDEKVNFSLEYFRLHYQRIKGISIVDREMQDTQFIALYEAATERDRLRERLEITHAFDGVGNKVPHPTGQIGELDGIACRDATIKGLDAQVKSMRGALEVAVNALKMSHTNIWAESLAMWQKPPQCYKVIEKALSEIEGILGGDGK
jgi:hypothetical protein